MRGDGDQQFVKISGNGLIGKYPLVGTIGRKKGSSQSFETPYPAHPKMSTIHSIPMIEIAPVEAGPSEHSEQVVPPAWPSLESATPL
jgi:hypothetical protein